MTGMPVTEFIERTLSRSASLDDAIPACREHRIAARAALARDGLPSGKIEHWKYTPISRFYDPAFATAETDRIDGDTVPPVAMQNAVTVRVAGTVPELTSSMLHSGLRMVRFSQADADQRNLIGRWLGHGIDPERHPLNLVNLALLEEGLLIHVTAGTRVTHPIDLQLVPAGRTAACSRVLLVVERDARLVLLEQYGGSMARNHVLEICLGDGARLDHYRVQPAAAVNTWQLVHANVGSAAGYRLHDYAFGGAPHRTEVHVRLLGRGADADLKGALIATAREKLDHQLCLEHVAAGCRSRQQFHGIALDRGELTFNGRIHIHAGAQKSDAQLSNRNLLGNDNARVNTKPELEIYADDVKCAHGATVGQLSEAEIFYFQSRGIPLPQARTMLLRAFVGAVLPDVPDAPPVHEVFAEVLKKWAA
jgi:Fe-S cluster assembly protein SufD